MLTVVFIWSFNWPAMATASHHIPPIWFSFFRLAIASLVLLSINMIMGKLKLPKDKAEIKVIILTGTLQVALNTLLIHLALATVKNISGIIILAYTTPLWVLLFSIIS